MAKRAKRYGGRNIERDDAMELERLGRARRLRRASESEAREREESLEDEYLDLDGDLDELDELDELDRQDRRR